MIMFSTSSSKYKKRERTQNWCIDEKKYLLELCRKDMYIIENKRLDSALTSLKNRAWKIIHKKFCHTFGTDRNCNRIKEQWRRMKACARAEILDYQHRVSKFGPELADKKKPSQFTFEIWDFMQDAKKLCKNELTDEVDYTKIKLTLEENMSPEDLIMDDEDAGTDSSHSSNWANTSQNICEVQIKDESSEQPRLPLIPEINGYFSNFQNTDTNFRNSSSNSMPDLTSDFFNFIKNQYLTQNEHLIRNLGTNKEFQSTGTTSTSSNNNSNNNEEKFKEHMLRMEILKIELETAKINKEIAEMNKEILLKQLNK